LATIIAVLRPCMLNLLFFVMIFLRLLNIFNNQCNQNNANEPLKTKLLTTDLWYYGWLCFCRCMNKKNFFLGGNEDLELNVSIR